MGFLPELCGVIVIVIFFLLVFCSWLNAIFGNFDKGRECYVCKRCPQRLYRLTSETVPPRGAAGSRAGRAGTGSERGHSVSGSGGRRVAGHVGSNTALS